MASKDDGQNKSVFEINLAGFFCECRWRFRKLKKNFGHFGSIRVTKIFSRFRKRAIFNLYHAEIGVNSNPRFYPLTSYVKNLKDLIRFFVLLLLMASKVKSDI